MDSAELKGALEAIIYAADEPATIDQLAEATGAAREEVLAAIDEMIGACGADERGIEIRRVARGFRYSTKARHHEVVRKFIKNLRPPVRLSMPALETLAVIAYRQPITLPEIHDVRGVNASGVIQTLLDKRLVTTAGRKAVIGRPILYRTTKEFLVRFGLEDVKDLPSIKDFEQIAREALGPDAGLEIEAEAEAEPVAAPESRPDGAPSGSPDGSPDGNKGQGVDEQAEEQGTEPSPEAVPTQGDEGTEPLRELNAEPAPEPDPEISAEPSTDSEQAISEPVANTEPEPDTKPEDRSHETTPPAEAAEDDKSTGPLA